MKKILITGVAGFIGFHCAKYFLSKNTTIYGIDNLDNYYSVFYKKRRLNFLRKKKKFIFLKIDITKNRDLKKLTKINFDYVYHFAAQPGVRYSLINPKKYHKVNVEGFEKLLKNINVDPVKKIIYASSSSVYGDQKKFPISENAVLKAKNPYGISKITNEKTAKNFSKKFKKTLIGLRLFTVYGEWGRPDMFILKFLDCIKRKRTFFLNKKGKHNRDFTYIGDVVKICYKFMKYKSKQKNHIFNICAGQKVNIKLLAKAIIKKYPNAKIKNIRANKADVKHTFGNNKKVIRELNYKKFFKIKDGLNKVTRWHQSINFNLN